MISSFLAGYLQSSQKKKSRGIHHHAIQHLPYLLNVYHKAPWKKKVVLRLQYIALNTTFNFFYTSCQPPCFFYWYWNSDPVTLGWVIVVAEVQNVFKVPVWSMSISLSNKYGFCFITANYAVKIIWLQTPHDHPFRTDSTEFSSYLHITCCSIINWINPTSWVDRPYFQHAHCVKQTHRCYFWSCAGCKLAYSYVQLLQRNPDCRWTRLIER